MRLGGADVLVLATERPGAELALRELQALGLRWPVIGGDALTGIEADGPLAAGVHVSSAYLPDRPDERNRDFVAAYARAYQGQRPDHRGAGAYDIVRLLARAIQAGGPDRQAIRDYPVKVGRGRPAFDGVTGAIAFDEHGDVAGKSVTIGVVQDGQLVTERGQGGGRGERRRATRSASESGWGGSARGGASRSRPRTGARPCGCCIGPSPRSWRHSAP